MSEKLDFTSHYKVMNKKDGVNLTLTSTSWAENLADLSSVMLLGVRISPLTVQLLI
jgi:hypothetical protein